MPWNLLILPLLGGYLFLHRCHQFRFASQRLEGYRLLINSAISGVVLAVAARVVLSLLVHFSWGRRLESLWLDFSLFPYSGTAFMAFFLGALTPTIWNWAVPKNKAKELAIEASGDPLLSLLFRAATNFKPLYMTLDNRKVYVGLVLGAPNLERDNAYLALLPLLSGYRDEHTLRSIFSVDYIAVYNSGKADPNDFQIIIPLARVASAHFFDPQIYKMFFAPVVEDKPSQTSEDLGKGDTEEHS